MLRLLQDVAKLFMLAFVTQLMHSPCMPGFACTPRVCGCQQDADGHCRPGP
jgi:hypothetical protein